MLTRFFASLMAFMFLVPTADAALYSYDCMAQMVVKDGSSITENFTLSNNAGGSHGGEAFEFTSGTYTLSVSADAKWMIVRWQKGDQIIASGLSLLGAESETARVLILVNPVDPDEQTSLTCYVQ